MVVRKFVRHEGDYRRGWRGGDRWAPGRAAGGWSRGGGGGRVEYIGGITESAPHQLWIHLINILTIMDIGQGKYTLCSIGCTQDIRISIIGSGPIVDV